MKVVQEYQEVLSGNSTFRSRNSVVHSVRRPIEYSVPAGALTLKTLMVAMFDRGRDANFRVTLYWDADGTGQNLQIVPQTPVYIKNKMQRVEFSNVQFISDGNSKLVIDRRIFDKQGKRFTYVFWTGDFS